MTDFLTELTVTILDILSFASVTTDLYGHRLDLADKILHGPKTILRLGIAESALSAGANAMPVMWAGAIILSLYRAYPLKNVLLWQGAILFLVAQAYPSRTHIRMGRQVVKTRPLWRTTPSANPPFVL